jgi:archaellum component FlaC
MPTNTINRAELLANLTAAAMEQKQTIEQEKEDSINQVQEAQENITRMSQNARFDRIQQYRDNVTRQQSQNRQFSEGYESLASLRERVKLVIRKESLQAREITKYKKLNKIYLRIKSQEIKEKQTEDQNRQADITRKAREIVGNILPFRQRNLSEIYEPKL